MSIYSNISIINKFSRFYIITLNIKLYKCVYSINYYYYNNINNIYNNFILL